MTNYKDLIKEKLSLKDLISHLGQSIKKNRVDCPLCGGNDAYLNPKADYNTVKCFNCGKYYNHFDWVMVTLGVGFKEALNYLLDLTGIKIGDYSAMIREVRFKQKEKRKNEKFLFDSESNCIKLNRLLDTAEEQGLHSDITEEMAINYRCALIRHRKLKNKLTNKK